MFVRNQSVALLVFKVTAEYLADFNAISITQEVSSSETRTTTNRPDQANIEINKLDFLPLTSSDTYINNQWQKQALLSDVYLRATIAPEGYIAAPFNG